MVIRRLPTPIDIGTIHEPRCRVFGSVAKSFPPSALSDSKGCGNINVEHVSRIKYYRTSHPEHSI